LISGLRTPPANASTAVRNANIPRISIVSLMCVFAAKGRA
jgi:hypothetical protein